MKLTRCICLIFPVTKDSPREVSIAQKDEVNKLGGNGEILRTITEHPYLIFVSPTFVYIFFGDFL